MEADKRKVLTVKDVKRDLSKKFCVSALFRLSEISLFVFTIGLFLFALSSAYDSYLSGHNGLVGICVFVLGAMFAYVLFGFGYHLFKLFVSLAKAFIVLDSKFNIVEDTLINSDSEEYNPFKWHAAFFKRPNRPYMEGYEDVMYFSEYGRLVLDSFEYISEDYGDEFYLVVYGKKNRILKAYNTKEYKIIK